MTTKPKPRILTNMAFWQSPEWMAHADSIYPLDPARGDPDFMPWWKEAWTLFHRRRGYDVVVTMGVRESFAFAALCRFTATPVCHVMTEVFIDAPRHTNPVWHLKNAWYRFLAPRTAGIITNSSEEVQTNARRYRLPVDRLVYVPLNTTVQQPGLAATDDGYYLCAGRTLRDYTTLVDVMRRTTKPWQVVAGRDDLAGIELPPNVTVQREIVRARYIDLLKRSSIVVLPLLETERATGQLVAMEAMSYGKPVITTDAPGTRDIIRHGENGILVAPGDANGIIDWINRLEKDTELRDRLVRTALHDMQATFSIETHTRLRLEAIDAFWKAWRERSG